MTHHVYAKKFMQEFIKSLSIREKHEKFMQESIKSLFTISHDVFGRPSSFLNLLFLDLFLYNILSLQTHNQNGQNC